jgi:hypothetical protein
MSVNVFEVWLENTPGSYTPALGGHNTGAAAWRKNAYTKGGFYLSARGKSQLVYSDRRVCPDSSKGTNETLNSNRR